MISNNTKQIGNLFIISGPSAVGKTTVTNEILKITNNIARVVTCTTRSIREGEVDGLDYNFIHLDKFKQLINEDKFVEYSIVYGNYYGVLLFEIAEKIQSNESSLLVMNWEGFRKIKKVFPENVFGFFLLPPTMDDLETRIRMRGANSEETIANRMNAAIEDISHADEFDFLIENADISKTVDDILSKIFEIKKCHLIEI